MVTALSDEHLERWVEVFRGPLIGLVASWGGDWNHAVEIAGDTFAEAWLARERFDADPDDLDAVGAWLRGVAYHLHLAAQRQRARHAPATPLVDALAAPGEFDDERRELLVEAFGKLSNPHQAVLRMAYLEQSSVAQVASLLGATPKAVENRLYQARRALRALVTQLARRRAEGVRP